jgi:hypothetical protein
MALTPPQGLEESDFETIEDAVLETARGRWFLREFARRARAADTGRLLEALGRIENLLSDREGPRSAPIIDGEQQARLLDERQERLSEIGWMLRERGYDGDICALIEKEARALARLAATLRGGRDAPARLEAPRAIAPAIEPEPVVVEASTPVANDAPDLPPLETPSNVSEVVPLPPRDWRESARTALAPIARLERRERLALFA